VVDPTVSVVIPAYNRADTIVRALDSVCAQTFSDLEIIVIDDASTDQTAALVHDYGDPRIRMIHHGTNRRAGAARNTGIRAARGRYVAFLDSDDEWTPDKLGIQIAALESAPAAVRASCTGSYLVENSREYPRVPRLLSHRQMLLGCDLAPGSTLVVRRDVFDTVGLNDAGFYRYEDWDWALRYAEHYQMGGVPRPLARIHRGARPPAAPTEAAARRILSRHGAAARRYGRHFARKVAATRHIELAEYFFRERRFHDATRCLIAALIQTPLVRPGLYVLVVDAAFGINLQGLLWRLIRRPARVGAGEGES